MKHKEIIPDPDIPFKNCQLSREKYSIPLNSLIETYSEGFVLAINNRWGSGKTTFIKMWQQNLINQNYKTIYFNAWENDFENNPLIALMGELKSISEKKSEIKFQSVIKKGAILSKSIVPILAKSIANKYIDSETVKDAISAMTAGTIDLFTNDVNEYNNKKKTISEFKTELSEFISTESNGKPIIFIIDELDRCRPNYSVSILEQIKHFFSIPNIIFILSIDKIQLSHAVRGVYGNIDIDANEYLKRFIDIEYSIPEPKSDLFYKYLYNYYEFDDFFNSPLRTKHRELNKDKELFLKTCEILFSNNNVTLRQQEKIFIQARVSLKTFRDNNYVMPQIFLLLIFLKIMKFNFYQKIKDKNYTIETLQQDFFEVFKANINEKTRRGLIWIEGYLLNYYNNYLYSNSYKKKHLYEYDQDKSMNVLLFNSIIDKSQKGNDDLLKAYEHLHGGNSAYKEIIFFINKIELLDNFS